MHRDLTFRLQPARLLAFLAAVAAVLLAGNVAGIIAKYHFGHDYIHGLVPLFNFDEENNFPSLFSALLLLACSALLWFISAARPKTGRSGYWRGLAWVFAFVACDEALQIHEKIDRPIRALLGTDGALYFAWVVPYSLLVAALGVVYLRFLWSLPSRPRFLMFSAAALFLTGALGFELIGSQLFIWSGKTGGVPFRTAVTLEESYEILGTMTFLYALLCYIREEIGPFRIEFGAGSFAVTATEQRAVLQAAALRRAAADLRRKQSARPLPSGYKLSGLRAETPRSQVRSRS